MAKIAPKLEKLEVAQRSTEGHHKLQQELVVTASKINQTQKEVTASDQAIIDPTGNLSEG